MFTSNSSFLWYKRTTAYQRHSVGSINRTSKIGVIKVEIGQSSPYEE